MRPSDIGTPIEIMGSWTITFNSGFSLTVDGAPSFKIGKSWVNLNNIQISNFISSNNRINFPEVKWDSKIELSDFTRKKGTFNLNNEKFAFMAGRFCQALNKRKNQISILKNRLPLPDYTMALFPENALTDSGKTSYKVSRCWVLELLDALFNIFEEASIPDEIIFKAPAKWLQKFKDGFITGAYYDPTNRSYVLSNRNKQMVADLAIVNFKLDEYFNYEYRNHNNVKETELLVCSPAKDSDIKIIDGYENNNLQLLYDIEPGEYNVSGVIMKD